MGVCTWWRWRWLGGWMGGGGCVCVSKNSARVFRVIRARFFFVWGRGKRMIN
jgi:hypothetical protein